MRDGYHGSDRSQCHRNGIFLLINIYNGGGGRGAGGGGMGSYQIM